MKKMIIGLVALGSITVHAAPDLSTYYCKHQKNPGFESRARYDIRIVEKNELSRGNNDARRAVTIERLRIVGSNSSLVSSFAGISNYNDVEYKITAIQEDFSFSMYLDENDPAIVISHDSSGTEVKNKYDCTIE